MIIIPYESVYNVGDIIGVKVGHYFFLLTFENGAKFKLIVVNISSRIGRRMNPLVGDQRPVNTMKERMEKHSI